MRERRLAVILMISLALALLASIGAFFLSMRILPVLASVAILTGLAAMFGLGFYVGQDTQPVPKSKTRDEVLGLEAPDHLRAA